MSSLNRSSLSRRATSTALRSSISIWSIALLCASSIVRSPTRISRLSCALCSVTSAVFCSVRSVTTSENACILSSGITCRERETGTSPPPRTSSVFSPLLPEGFPAAVILRNSAAPAGVTKA
ncbi:MAG: hypothetical protein BWY99_02804 [Synergistetes bacterium ADurb.BinA166]|nr:MAG: hypothetical protein BWY99_02804 [Synergistetes bacterium ADurb.BinA166]